MPYNSPWLVDQASVKFLTILKILETKLSSRNFSPKNQRTNLFFYPDSPEMLETWNQNLEFQVIPDRQDRKQIRPFVFGRSFFSSILLLRFIDL